ncbi:hypothetical protein ACMD2_13410 [Ananas comosus]|uniref:2-oxoadipate dioxygenase/decarboxylase n=1 Tax=Ananas comosus TaxID=4615 RepID=A0A199UE54_ANACO|nr:hypothetical protein ACMD2_13410 [Ananas comosus]
MLRLMEAAALLRSPTATSLSLRCSTPSTTRSSTTPFARLSLSPPTLRRPISSAPRALAMAARSAGGPAPSDPLPKGADAFFRTVISNMEKVYLSRNPTAKAVLDLVQSHDGNNVCYDHFAFRTFGVGSGRLRYQLIGWIFHGFWLYTSRRAKISGKKAKGVVVFPSRFLLCSERNRCRWAFAENIYFRAACGGDEFSMSAIIHTSYVQEVIRKYIETSGSGHKHAVLASTSGCLTWEKPIYSDYQILSRESEYAAWTLVNGYALNHVTISTHRLKSHIRSIKSLNQFIEDSGFKLNSEGGILKVSPDGLLQQSSTVADTASFTFADGVTESVPCSYIEFAERLLLPQYKDLREEEVKEFHRRDGFEVGNADKIFESTSKDQLSRKVA